MISRCQSELIFLSFDFKQLEIFQEMLEKDLQQREVFDEMLEILASIINLFISLIVFYSLTLAINCNLLKEPQNSCRKDTCQCTITYGTLTSVKFRLFLRLGNI